MKNIIPYPDNSYDFHEKVVKSKRNSSKDLTYKNRVLALLPIVKPLFLTHTDKFATNSLYQIIAHGFTGQNKADLEKLYKYSSTYIQSLKVALTTVHINIVDTTCPYCTINNIGTMDHYLPISVYPEFAVNPKNLFPMCSECNTTKLNISSNLFLNLYLDLLPPLQFLFVSIDSELKPTFVVENRNGIDSRLFQTIVSHYSRLNLCGRFQENSYKVISKLNENVQGYLLSLDLDTIQSTTIQIANKMRGIYGVNHWESILEIALIQNQDFLDTFS